MLKSIIFTTLITLALHAQILISPQEALESSFGKDATIEMHNILLTKEQLQEVQKIAKSKLDTKIFKIFFVTKENVTLGYGVLVSQKVRSKNGVILYNITPDKRIKNIEVIAFNEPLEYLPSTEWKEQFSNKPENAAFKLAHDIPAITGATLSARAIADGAKIAFALLEVIKE